MEDRLIIKDFIFKYQSGMVRVSEREEKILEDLIDKYGTLRDVPKAEVISVYFVEYVKDEFLADGKYFYVPVNELRPVNGRLPGKRRGVFLNFAKLLKIKG